MFPPPSNKVFRKLYSQLKHRYPEMDGLYVHNNPKVLFNNPLHLHYIEYTIRISLIDRGTVFLRDIQIYQGIDRFKLKNVVKTIMQVSQLPMTEVTGILAPEILKIVYNFLIHINHHTYIQVD